MSTGGKLKGTIADIFCRFLAWWNPVRLVCAVYNGTARVRRLPEAVASAHLAWNESLWEKRKKELLQTARDGRTYLEYQHGMGRSEEKEPFLYGAGGRKFSRDLHADYNSCEVIAVYNLQTFLLGEAKESFPKLLQRFERKGAALGGAFGSTPAAVEQALEESGFVWERLRGKACSRSAVDALSRKYDAFIVMLYNDRTTLRAGVHTMCVTRFTKDGTTGYLMHNDYRSFGGKWYPTLHAAVEDYNGGKAGWLEIIGAKVNKETK